MLDKIKAAIAATISQFLDQVDDVYDINCGLCEDFAVEVIDKLGGENDTLHLVWIEDLVNTPAINACHAVIAWYSEEGWIYFDAECPEGTDIIAGIPAVKNRGRRRRDVIAERR